MSEAPPEGSVGGSAGANAGDSVGDSVGDGAGDTDAADARPRRVRVTAPGALAHDGVDTAAAPSPPASGQPRPGERSAASDEVYVRALIRSQLRVALVVASGFFISLLAFSLTLRLIPELGKQTWLGVPIAWLLLGFGVYPMIGLSAWLYVRVASRNESRYLALAEESA